MGLGRIWVWGLGGLGLGLGLGFRFGFDDVGGICNVNSVDE